MKRVRLSVSVLLVLIMLGNVVCPAMAATEKIDKNTRKINTRTEIFKEFKKIFEKV